MATTISICPNAGSDAWLQKTRHCFAGQQDHPTKHHAIFSYGDMLGISSFYLLYHRICLHCKDESSLLSQKLTVTRCSGYKWEMDYCLDVCHVTKVVTYSTWGIKKKKKGEFLSPFVDCTLQSSSPFNCTNFMKCVREMNKPAHVQNATCLYFFFVTWNPQL